MKQLVPRSKMSKIARRRLDSGKRVIWGFVPLTRKVESAKRFHRADTAERKEWVVSQREMP